MVTALKPETEATIEIVEANPATVEAATPAAVDVTGVPETPSELLKQWDASRKPLIHTIIAATLVRAWNAIAGPPMSDRDRLNRQIAEAKGFCNGFVKLP